MLAPAVSFADINNLDIGGDVKSVAVWSNNLVDLQDEDDSGDFEDSDGFLRMEAHLWFEATLADNVKAKISFEVDRDWEGNADEEGAETGSNSVFSGDSDLNVFLEEAWIKAPDLFGSVVSLSIGRQFLQYGDGFIIGDSQPDSPVNLKSLGEWEQDPFDAAVLSADFDGIIADVVYAKSVEEHDADADSDLFGLHVQTSRLEPHVFSAYYWFLRTEDESFARYDKVYSAGEERLQVVGIRAEGELPLLNDPTLSYVGEFAYQFGDVEDVEFDGRTEDISAFAAHAGLMWRPEATIGPMVGFDYFFLSGGDGFDDEGQLDDENEWRQVFENHTYGEIAENWVFTNMHIFSLCLGADNLMDGKLEAMLKYYYFLLDEEDSDFGYASLATSGPGYYDYDKASSSGSGYAYPYASTAALNGDDNDFGHEVDLFLTYNVSESLVAKVAGGVFIPGDAIETLDTDGEGFESQDADEAYFVRGEVAVKF
jgi:hypothetical protein